MNRREAIQRTMLALGYAISAPALMGVLNGCRAKPELAYVPDFFNKDQALLISELSEIIIPKTDTPGAKEAGVPGFIDSMVKEAYSKEQQDEFIKDMAAFDGDAKKMFGDSFAMCSHDDKVAVVKKHHDAALAESKGGGATGWWNAGTGSKTPFILTIKELTLLGFFTSKLGATEVLQYNPVPGPYQGCVDLEKVGKAWAT